MNKPLLSICIPTYNRVEYLRKTLESIVHQDGFGEEVEVVISDNASTDNTRELAMDYCSRYTNIKYFRNEKNLVDENQALSIQRATGILRKLSNDTLMYKPGAVRYILDAIKKNIDEKPVLFFRSSGALENEEIFCQNLDVFVSYMSFNITWIGSIAYWDEDCADMARFIADAPSRLPQVPHLLKCVEKRKAIVYDRKLFDSQTVKRKNLNYGLHKVFYINFLGFLNEFVDKGSISERTYEKVRKDLLFIFFPNWVIRFERHPEDYTLGSENLRKAIHSSYKDDSYYMKYRIKLFLKGCKAVLKDIKSRLGRGFNG